jgi:hypothetical protein
MIDYWNNVCFWKCSPSLGLKRYWNPRNKLDDFENIWIELSYNARRELVYTCTYKISHLILWLAKCSIELSYNARRELVYTCTYKISHLILWLAKCWIELSYNARRELVYTCTYKISHLILWLAKCLLKWVSSNVDVIHQNKGLGI